MIIDQLSNGSFYYPLNNRIALALRYLQETDFTTLPAGKYEIDGSHVFALLQETESKPQDLGFWEAHRRYLDIHCVLTGAERIGFAHINGLIAGQYDEEKDFQILEGEGFFCTAIPGLFVLLMPYDAHMPCIAVKDPAPLRKVVIKVEIGK